MTSHRLFVALPIPHSVRETLARQQQALRQICERRLSYPPPENFHLTLCFLGEVESFQVEPLSQALEIVAAQFKASQPALEITCARLGCFPHLRAPRVVWAGVTSPKGELEQLATLVKAASGPFTSFQEEANFVGHITLARVRQLDGRAALAAHLEETAPGPGPFGRWTATHMQLVQSEMGAHPVRYKVLEGFALQDENAG